MYFDTTLQQLQACNGTTFFTIGAGGGGGDGGTSDDTPTGCDAVLAATPSAANGIYTINPTQIAGQSYQVYCNMDIHGGGWQLAMNIDPSDGNIHPFSDVSFWTGNGGFGSLPNALAADFKSQRVFTSASRTTLAATWARRSRGRAISASATTGYARSAAAPAAAAPRTCSTTTRST